ncbi:hypothetical protein [Peterkaempfera bronchialis]|uniref:Uncharacterized protein n=1 Tax=Peterkaempfera bronchialis TaxID=2126346 RepID=A0A345SSS3_9ACTN|nr:hypothetical protein [Peterkaempfera bronchialis]AXI76778.1 hypothetical protein C7M71_004225 [Peterkaempfera bronchialis]
MAAAFAMSYRDLTEHQACLFRRLGLHPGTEIDVYAAAALMDLPVGLAGRLLEQLYGEHLLEERVRGRFQTHDLLRHYARTLAEQDLDADNTAALDRLLDYYQHTAEAADALINDTGGHPSPASASLPTSLRLVSRTQALAWMEAERAALVASGRRRRPTVKHSTCSNPSATTSARPTPLRDWLVLGKVGTSPRSEVPR